MTDEERRLRERLHTAGLPAAPARLSQALEEIVAAPAARRREGAWTMPLLAAAALLAVGGALLVAGSAGPNRPVASPQPAAVFPAEVDGQHVYTVSELLAARAAGQLEGGPIALAGFWSDPLIAHSCAPPSSQPGELELYCHDREFGITQRNEPSAVLAGDATIAYAAGPVLTPWVPGPLLEQLLLAPVNGQPFPPVPIVVIGHLDDPRAADCRPEARRACLDRFVVDEIVEFGVAAVPTPGVTPMPTPFPFDSAPPAPFSAEQCHPPGTDEPVEFSFFGWIDGADVDLTSGRGFAGETLYVAIARDVVPLGDWYTPYGATGESRPMGRLVCLATERDLPGIVQFDSLAGTAFRTQRDGSTIPPSP